MMVMCECPCVCMVPSSHSCLIPSVPGLAQDQPFYSVKGLLKVNEYVLWYFKHYFVLHSGLFTYCRHPHSFLKSIGVILSAHLCFRKFVKLCCTKHPHVFPYSRWIRMKHMVHRSQHPWRENVRAYVYLRGLSMPCSFCPLIHQVSLRSSAL